MEEADAKLIVQHENDKVMRKLEWLMVAAVKALRISKNSQDYLLLTSKSITLFH